MATASFKLDHLPSDRKPWSKRKKTTVTLGILLPLLALLAITVYFLTRPHAPDPAKLTAEQSVKYLVSKDFSALPEPEKEAYIKRVRAINGDNTRQLFSQNLTQEERQALRQNTREIFQKEMKERMKKFFAMSKEEQMKALNEDIARWGQGGPRGGPGRAPPGGGGGGNRNDFRRQMLEGTDSTTRAQFAEYRKLLRQARQQQQQQQQQQPAAKK